MKINTTTKKIIEIELSITDARNGLKQYQLTQLSDMAANLKCYSPEDQSHLFWNLMQGERSVWFENIIESNSLYWLHTPTRIHEWIELIEEFPNIFIHDASNVLKDCSSDTLTVRFEGHDVSSDKMLNNI